MKLFFSKRRAAGFTLIEVLVTLLVFSVGLLGFASLQNRAQKAELEVYQRVFALNLLYQMVDQIYANPHARGCYGLGNTVVGTGYTGTYSCSAYGTSETQARVADDINQWSDQLKGVGESRDGASVGGLLNARGCIQYNEDSDNAVFVVSVAWQGLVETVASSSSCADANYGGSASKVRRVVEYTLRLPNLDKI